MGQVTRAIGARPRLILPPDATPERWRHCATTTIQQTTLRGNGNVVPESVSRSYSRDSIPILGSTSEGTIGGSPGGSAATLATVSYERRIAQNLLQPLVRHSPQSEME